MVAALIALVAWPAVAQVVVTQGWVRGVVAGQKSTGAFMHLTSSSDVTLIGIESPAAGSAELHNMQFASGMMKMRALDKLPLRAGKTVELEPGSHHVMLMDLKQPLRDGDLVPMTLRFEDRTGRKWTIDVKLPVRPLAASSSALK